jgi:cytochrome c oxidase subunit 2
MPQAPTAHVETVDFVMLYIVGISVVLLLGITATMIYFVFKYHRKHGHKPVDIPHNTLLEVIWIVIPTLLVLSMFYFGYTGFEESRYIPKNAFDIKVTARMWQWQFEYPNGKKTDSLYVPVNRAVKLEIKSMDVNHALYIPAFRLKEDAIFGQTNYLSFTAREVGDYEIACAEYCGLNHSMMYSKVKVMPEQDFAAWYDSKDEQTLKAGVGQ